MGPPPETIPNSACEQSPWSSSDRCGDGDCNEAINQADRADVHVVHNRPGLDGGDGRQACQFTLRSSTSTTTHRWRCDDTACAASATAYGAWFYLCLLGAARSRDQIRRLRTPRRTARRTGQRQDVDRRGGREIGAERDGVQSRRQEHRRGQGWLCQRHARHPESAPHRACAGGAFLHSLSGPGRDGGQGRHHGDSTRWLRTWIRPGRQATMRSCFTRLAEWRHWESTSRRHQRRVQPVRPRRLPLLRLRRHAGAKDHRRQRRSRCSRISRSIHT